jgi:RHS repeat-associated protein
LGRPVSVTRPYEFVPTGATQNTYDSLDRLLQRISPDSSTVKHAYSMYQTDTWDAGNNGSINHRYVQTDVEGRAVVSAMVLTSANQPDKDVKTAYHYGAFSQPESITVDNGPVTTMGYDTLGRRTQVDEPDHGITTTDYNGFGEIRHIVDKGLNQSQNYVHDDLGRVITKNSPEGTTTWEWDTNPNGIGRLARTKSTDNILSNHRYDTLGRAVGVDVTDELGGQYSIDAHYDDQGRLDTLAYPQVPGRTRLVAKYSYTSLSYLKKIEDVSKGAPQLLWQVDQRNADLALTDGTVGNGIISVHRDYDAVLGQLKSMKAAHAGTDVLDTFYEYWPNGLVKSRTTGDGVAKRIETFDYDSLARLTTWNLGKTTPQAPPPPMVPTQYAYDTLGNLTDITTTGVSEHRVYGNPNGSQPHAMTHKIAGGIDTAYSYDALGRLFSNADRKIGYTSFDLPKTVQNEHGTWTYLYDAAGARVKKSGTDGTTRYVGGLYELRQSGGDITHVFHVNATDGAVVELDYKPSPNPTAEGPTTVLYPLTDALGSTGEVVDATGNVIERDYYDPFGQRTNADGSLFAGTTGPVKQGFTGQEHDDQVGLINFRGRMYDPAIKRFLTPDPIVSAPGHSQSWNPYSYVMNSPLNLVDRSGFDWSAGTTPCAGAFCVADGTGGSALGAAEVQVTIPAAPSPLEGVDAIGLDAPPPYVGTTVYDSDPGAHAGAVPSSYPAGRMDDGSYRYTGNNGAGGSGAGPDRQGGEGGDRYSWKNVGHAIITAEVAVITSPARVLTSKTPEEATVAAADALAFYGPLIAESRPLIMESRDTDVLGMEAASEEELDQALGGGCFVAGTPVQTATGPRPIESMQVGELVASRDERTNETAYKPIVRLIRHQDQEIVNVTLVDEDGNEDVIEATPEHPFHVNGDGWVGAGRLHVGDHVDHREAGLLVVQRVERNSLRQSTFNFEVADLHTYFVGTSGAWVHNNGKSKSSKPPSMAARRAALERGFNRAADRVDQARKHYQLLGRLANEQLIRKPSGWFRGAGWISSDPVTAAKEVADAEKSYLEKLEELQQCREQLEELDVQIDAQNPPPQTMEEWLRRIRE